MGTDDRKRCPRTGIVGNIVAGSNNPPVRLRIRLLDTPPPRGRACVEVSRLPAERHGTGGPRPGDEGDHRSSRYADSDGIRVPAHLRHLEGEQAHRIRRAGASPSSSGPPRSSWSFSDPTRMTAWRLVSSPGIHRCDSIPERQPSGRGRDGRNIRPVVSMESRTCVWGTDAPLLAGSTKHSRRSLPRIGWDALSLARRANPRVRGELPRAART